MYMMEGLETRKQDFFAKKICFSDTTKDKSQTKKERHQILHIQKKSYFTVTDFARFFG